MKDKTLKYGSLWSREELILALYLYCQIPFSKTTKTNPEVIKLSAILGRTPSSVARKLGNFGAFDEKLAARGVSGLTHYGKADKEIWNEFAGNWELLVEKSQLILSKSSSEQLFETKEVTNELPTDTITERQTSVLVRLKQSFFRKTVLASYGNSCCFCGIHLQELLIASHIIPWSKRKETRIDPRNGLLLCALHDKAFDKGLMTVKPDFRIAVASKAFSAKSEFMQITLSNFNNSIIRLPSRFVPKIDYLSWHNENIFQEKV